MIGGTNKAGYKEKYVPNAMANMAPNASPSAALATDCKIAALVKPVVEEPMTFRQPEEPTNNPEANTETTESEASNGPLEYVMEEYSSYESDESYDSDGSDDRIVYRINMIVISITPMFRYHSTFLFLSLRICFSISDISFFRISSFVFHL